MKFRVLGCSGGQIPGHNLSSFLVNDSLLIDAGSATSVLRLKAQQKIISNGAVNSKSKFCSYEFVLLLVYWGNKN